MVQVNPDQSLYGIIMTEAGDGLTHLLPYFITVRGDVVCLFRKGTGFGSGGQPELRTAGMSAGINRVAHRREI
jgi:hypothetical protein